MKLTRIDELCDIKFLSYDQFVKYILNKTLLNDVTWSIIIYLFMLGWKYIWSKRFLLNDLEIDFSFISLYLKQQKPEYVREKSTACFDL